jgi:hypothetical protein
VVPFSACLPKRTFSITLRPTMQNDLDDVVSQDCPSCGEIAIRVIEEPFIPEVCLCVHREVFILVQTLVSVSRLT